MIIRKCKGRKINNMEEEVKSEKIEIEIETEKRDIENDKNNSKDLTLDTQQEPEPHPEAVEEITQDSLEKEIQNLKAELEKKDEELKDIFDRLLRNQAEFENFKKRINREREDFIRYSNENLIRELLPFIDNLERAIEHSKKSDDFSSLLEGIKLTLTHLLNSLKKFGLEPTSSIGETFDPLRHEAVTIVESDDHNANTIIGEHQKGYTLNGRLLRPALVTVSKPISKDREPEDKSDREE